MLVGTGDCVCVGLVTISHAMPSINPIAAVIGECFSTAPVRQLNVNVSIICLENSLFISQY